MSTDSFVERELAAAVEVARERTGLDPEVQIVEAPAPMVVELEQEQ